MNYIQYYTLNGFLKTKQIAYEPTYNQEGIVNEKIFTVAGIDEPFYPVALFHNHFRQFGLYFYDLRDNLNVLGVINTDILELGLLQEKDYFTPNEIVLFGLDPLNAPPFTLSSAPSISVISDSTISAPLPVLPQVGFYQGSINKDLDIDFTDNKIFTSSDFVLISFDDDFQYVNHYGFPPFSPSLGSSYHLPLPYFQPIRLNNLIITFFKPDLNNPAVAYDSLFKIFHNKITNQVVILEQYSNNDFTVVQPYNTVPIKGGFEYKTIIVPNLSLRIENIV